MEDALIAMKIAQGYIIVLSQYKTNPTEENLKKVQTSYIKLSSAQLDLETNHQGVEIGLTT